MAYEAETRLRFEKTVNGLLGVMNIVKDYEGRKSLLYVSGGAPSLSFTRFFEGGAVSDTTAIQSQVAAAKVNDPFKVLGRKTFRTGSESSTIWSGSRTPTTSASTPWTRTTTSATSWATSPTTISRGRSAGAPRARRE